MPNTRDQAGTRILLLAICLYALGAGAYVYYTHKQTEETLLAEIDRRLLLAAYSTRYVLPSDFHDKATSPDSMNPETYRDIARQLSLFANSQGFTYVYTMVLRDGKVLFTSSSQKPEERENDAWEDYFLEYSEASPHLIEQFRRTEPLQETATDRWGTFRSAIVRQVSPGGNVYVAGADYDISYINEVKYRNLVETALGALLFAGMSIPMIVAYRTMHRKEMQALRAENVQLDRDLSRQELESQRLSAQKITLEELVEVRTHDLQISEARRRASEHLLSVAFNHSPVAMSLVAIPSGMVINANPAFEQLTGVPHDTVAGQTLHEAGILDVPAHHEMLELAQKTAPKADTKATPWECAMKTRAGEERTCQVTLHRFIDQSQDLALAVWSDVTESRQMQSMLVHSERMAAVGVMAAGIAHEFNNALSSLIGFLEMIRIEAQLDPKNAQRLEIACRSADRIAETTHKMLDFSRQGSSEKRACDLNQILRDGLELLQKDLQSHGIDVLLHLEPLPEAFLAKNEIEQVFLNLMINSQHALTEQDIRRITVSSGRKEEEVFFQVKDTGCGIRPEHLEKIFLPFFSRKGEHAGENSPMQKVKGTGLGLSVSNQIVREHGGRFVVSSAVDVGTTITVWLPLHGQQQPEAPCKDTAAARTRGRRLIVYPPTVAILDDEPAIRSVFCANLGHLGYPAIEVDKPERLLSLAAEGMVDIALLDLQMPSMPGTEVLRKLHKLPPEFRPVCIVISGRVDLDVIKELQPETYFTILKKPCKPQVLKETIEEILNTPPDA